MLEKSKTGAIPENLNKGGNDFKLAITRFFYTDMSVTTDGWRLTILNAVLYATFILALLSAIAGSNNQIQDGRYHYVFFYVASLLILSAATFWKRINYNLRVAVLLITFYAVAVSELLASGLTGDGDHFLTTIVILSGILLNRNKGLVIFTLTVLTLKLVAYLTVNGYIKLAPFLGEVSYRPRNWASAISAYVFMTALMFISTVFMRRKMEETIGQNQDSIAKLIKENRIREEREQSLKIFKQLLTTSYDAIAYIDQKNSIVTANDAFFKEFIRMEKDRHQSENKIWSLDDLLLEDIGANIETAQKGEKQLLEHKIMNGSGSEKYLEILLTPFVGKNQQPDGIVFVARDITYKVKMEQDLIEMNEEEHRTFSMLLHDGLSHFLLNLAIQCNMIFRKLKKNDSPLTAEVKHLEGQINEAISLTRNISNGLFPVTLKSLNLVEILEQKKKLLEESFNILCTINADPDLFITDKTVAIHLHYIIQEAVINIIKHSGATAVEINLQQDKSIYELLISDNGRGNLAQKNNVYSGAGIKIMEHRAKTINGELSVIFNENGKAEVHCQFPLSSLEKNDLEPSFCK